MAIRKTSKSMNNVVLFFAPQLRAKGYREVADVFRFKGRRADTRNAIRRMEGF